MKNVFRLLLCAGVLWFAGSVRAADKPNLIFILCDDLGYGDVGVLNPDGKIKTPNIDALARGGMIFTDAHSSSSVCTPTRYGVMTGRYNWRTKLQNGVLGGLSPRLIEPGRETVASFLKQHGYRTGAVGKWHLGMDWEILPGKTVNGLSIESPDQVRNVDYSKPVKNGPKSVGFDYYFGISASLDMVPYTFIENDRVTRLPTEDRDFPLFLGRAQGRCRKGPTAPGFEVEQVLPTLTQKAIEFINANSGPEKKNRPFFLYLPYASPHTPVAPNQEWQGKSGVGYYGDFVMETDWGVGEILKALDRNGIAENTLIVFTSDNGCSPQADFAALAEHGHNPSYRFRGHKADIYDGGHRVPFIVRWPAKVKAGTQSGQLACLTDFFATAADIIGAKVPDDAAEDSVSLLPALLGKEQHFPIREAVVHHSINGAFSIRQGPWKLELCPGSGGWSEPRPGRTDMRHLPPVQLYNFDRDPGERTNVQDQHPDIVRRMTVLLQSYVDRGRSTPGPNQANAVPVDIWKAGKAAHAAKVPQKKKAAPKK